MFPVAGLPGDKAFQMGVGYLAVGFVGTVLSFFVISKFGRRRIYNIGLGTLSIMMFLIAILDCAPDYKNRPGVIWAQSTLMVGFLIFSTSLNYLHISQVIWNGIYDVSIGPVCFVILCECSATKVRSKTIALATAVQALLGIVMTVAIPYMINPDQANMRGKLGFFFGKTHVVKLHGCV